MVLHSLYPHDPRVRRQADAAVEAGYAVDIVCVRQPGQPGLESSGHIRVRRLPLKHVPGGGTLRMIYEYLAFAILATLMLIPPAVRRRYMAVHVNNPPDFLIVAGLLPRLFGSRLILDVHDLSAHMFRSRFAGPIGRAVSSLLEAVERSAARVAHVVVTVHEPYRKELVANRIAEDKIIVVMNVAEDGLERRSTINGRRTTAPGFTVAYAGTIAPWYGVHVIVDAVAMLAKDIGDVRAVILGTGDALDAARARAEEQGVSDRITFSGEWLPADEMFRQLRAASCGVIPNLPTELNRFALSTKLFDYVAIGLPAVVSRLETLEAHFDEDEVTFFEPGDARSLAAALRWVALHPAEAEAKAIAALDRVAREYSWEQNRDRYLRAVEPGR
jgi:glycosyltransferase involved in cell wall biosynthesis